MKSARLRYLTSRLDEADGLSRDPDLLRLLSNIREFNFGTVPVQLANYKLSSFSLFTKRDVEAQEESHEHFAQLLRAHTWLEKDFDPSVSYSQNKIVELNRIILDADSTRMRIKNFKSDYDFLPFELMDEAFVLTQKVAISDHLEDFVRAVLLFQLLLSIHPFENGNHRTLRLLLDHHLIKINLLPTTVRSNSDLILANPYLQPIFSLEDAVQKVLFNIGNTMTAYFPDAAKIFKGH